jgi:hypothetical protein
VPEHRQVNIRLRGWGMPRDQAYAAHRRRRASLSATQPRIAATTTRRIPRTFPHPLTRARSLPRRTSGREGAALLPHNSACDPHPTPTKSPTTR